MSFLRNVFAPAALVSSARPKPRPLTLDPSWTPPARVDRIITHWTAGSGIASDLDKEHYHFLIEADGTIRRGLHPITAQTPPLREGHYAAHTRSANSYAIGIALCGMVGAQESPFYAGKHPITELQWQRLAELIAKLARRYELSIGPKTVLTHAEVQPNLGIKQAGKWDIARLPWNLKISGPRAVGDDMRRRVELML